MMVEEQHKLFEALHQLDPSVVEDGISDEAAYIAAPYHIMYVLKEVNGGSGWSLCEHLKHGGRQQNHDATWDNVARWTEGIFALPKEIAWDALERGCEERRKMMLPQICAINIKKTSGSAVADSKKVYTEALNNTKMLQRQLELYAPELVVCCGTAGAFVDVCFQGKMIEWKMTSRGVRYFRMDDMVVIDFSHPAARVKDCYLYYALLDAVKEIGKILVTGP